jgi:hypothetical protein
MEMSFIVFSYEASNAFNSSTVSPAAASFSMAVGGSGGAGGAGAGSGVLPAANHCWNMQKA